MIRDPFNDNMQITEDGFFIWDEWSDFEDKDVIIEAIKKLYKEYENGH